MERRGKPSTWLPRQKLAEERKGQTQPAARSNGCRINDGLCQQRPLLQQRPLSATAVAAIVVFAAAPTTAVAAATVIAEAAVIAAATAVVHGGRYCGVGRLAVVYYLTESILSSACGAAR